MIKKLLISEDNFSSFFRTKAQCTNLFMALYSGTTAHFNTKNTRKAPNTNFFTRKIVESLIIRDLRCRMQEMLVLLCCPAVTDVECVRHI